MQHKIRVASAFLLLFCGMARGQDLISAVEQDAENEWTMYPADMIDAIALHGDDHDSDALRRLGQSQSDAVKLRYKTAWERSKDDFWNAIVRGNQTSRSCQEANTYILAEFNDSAGLEALQRSSNAYQKQHNFSALAELLRQAPPDPAVSRTAYRDCYFATPSPDALFKLVETVLGPRK